MIIHLNGWPGVGKRTIGKVLARQLEARFIHNHLLHDVAIVCCGINDPHRWQLYDKVQKAAYEALMTRPLGEIFVMTNALCRASARERVAWNHVVDLAIGRQVPLVPIVLEATLAENERRLQAEDRIGQKMTDPQMLRSFLAADQIQKPEVAELLVLDVTKLSAEQASHTIREHVAQLARPLPAASERHRVGASQL